MRIASVAVLRLSRIWTALKASRAFRWGLLFGCIVLIAVLSLVPFRVVPRFVFSLPCFDKVGHFVLYATLAALAFWSFRGIRRVHLRTMPVFAGSVAYGVLMEFMQRYMTAAHRSFSQGDIMANSAGAAVCLFVLSKSVRAPRAAMPLLLLFLGGMQ